MPEDKDRSIFDYYVGAKKAFVTGKGTAAANRIFQDSPAWRYKLDRFIETVGNEAAPYVDKFLDLLSNPNVEALGDAIDQVERGTPPSPVKVGMVFSGKALGAVPQFAKFLRRVVKQARSPAMKEVRSLRGWSVPKSNLSQNLARALFETRRNTSTARVAGDLADVPANRATRALRELRGEFFPFKQLERGNTVGLAGTYADVPGGANVDDLYQTMHHEIGGHGVQAERALRTDQNLATQYQKELQQYGYQNAPLEIEARHMAAVGEKDLNAFFKRGDELYGELPKEERTIYDAIKNIYNQSEVQRRNALSGDYDSAVEEGMRRSWQDIIGGGPVKPREVLDDNFLLDDSLSAMKTSRATTKKTFPAGSFVDINGKEYKMKGDQMHIDVVSKLNRQKKEARGFEVREGNVRINDPDYLNYKDGLDAAMESAYKLGYLRYGKSPPVLVEMPGIGYISVPLEEKRRFLQNPLGYFKKHNNAGIGLDFW